MYTTLSFPHTLTILLSCPGCWITVVMTKLIHVCACDFSRLRGWLGNLTGSFYLLLGVCLYVCLCRVCVLLVMRLDVAGLVYLGPSQL
jgi:hypothetical protein